MVSKREKEPERDSNDSKKHRKTNTSTSNDQSQKVIKEDIYAVSTDQAKNITHKSVHYYYLDFL